MPEIAKAGIACVKIEGRLKDAAYVRAIVSAYRKAIDTGEQTDLSKLTSRGYTDGYLIGGARKEKLTNPNAPSFSGTLLGKVTITSRHGAQILLSSPLSVGDSIRASSSGKIIEVYRIYRRGKEVKVAEDECTLLIKTIRAGDTLYKVPRAQIEDDFLKSYAPNKTKTSRAYKYESKKLVFPPLPSLTYLFDKKQLQASAAGAFVVPFEGFSTDRLSHSSKLVVDTPRVAFDSELPAIEKRMREISEQRPLAFMVSEPSLISVYPTILSPYANITNTLAARAWQEFGNVRGVVPSLEIAQAEKENLALGFANYAGYPQELMISENDLFFELGLDADKGKYELEDPRGNRFEITRSGGRTAIMKG